MSQFLQFPATLLLAMVAMSAAATAQTANPNASPTLEAKPNDAVVETEVFFPFRCVDKSDACGVQLAEEYCRNQGMSLADWESHPSGAPDSEALFRLSKIVCRKVAPAGPR